MKVRSISAAAGIIALITGVLFVVFGLPCKIVVASVEGAGYCGYGL